MKFLKYFAIMAVASVMSFTIAQAQAKSSESTVAVAMDDGVITLNVNFDVGDATVSSEDALKKALASALKSLGNQSLISKALVTTMASLKSAMSDPSFPAKGPIQVAIKLRQPETNTVEASVEAKIAGETYRADTRSIADGNGNIATQGNVVTTKSDGSSAATSVNVKTDVSGNITGNVGSGSVSEKTPAAEASEELVASPEKKSAKSGESREIIPDPTVVTSETRK